MHSCTDLCQEKYITVYQVLSSRGLLTFRSWLPYVLFAEWMNILEKVYSYDFDNTEDIVTSSSRWCNSGMFSTKSVYNDLASNDVGLKFTHIWKAKIPYKIKIFNWLVEKGAILTKDNLAERNWTSDLTCCFCHEPKTINHLFFLCPVARVIWRMWAFALGRQISQKTLYNITYGCKLCCVGAC